MEKDCDELWNEYAVKFNEKLGSLLYKRAYEYYCETLNKKP